MGNCTGKTDVPKIRRTEITHHESKLHRKEFLLLQIIYNDLASRIKVRQLDKQNFLLFFHKNGLWGERLFKEFDANDSNYISEEQFIRGIEKIFKTTEEFKIKLLFKFLSGGSHETQGIPFSEFLKMLYNYPKEDLQKILNDSDFVDKEIKSHLVAVGSEEFQGRRFVSVCPNDMKDIRLMKTQFQFKDSDKNSDRMESKMGRDILREISQKKEVKNTILKIKVGQNDVEIKTSSIHQFVKKFARSIFKSYEINEKVGALEYEHFKDWIQKHKNLYDDYYSGFHSEIWEIDKATQLPEFIKRQFSMTSRSRYVIEKSPPLKIKVSLLHSILILTEQEKQEWPLDIICLDGLSVQKIFDSENGNGISIKHRDKYYPEKKFYFLNQGVQLKWIEQLKFFKGSSINALYEIGQEIGKGKFSLVYQGTEIATGEKCALKIIDKKKLDKESLQLIAHQSSIMSVLSHPLMVYFKETIQTNNNIYIVTELVKGKDLFEFVKDVKYLQEKEAAFIFKQIIVGVRYLHSLGIIHRDLKPENVMVQCDENGEISKIKIIDFGFANYLTVLRQLDQTELMAGTPNYIAPEILTQTEFSQKIDNFAIGSMLYFSLSGSQPFGGDSIAEILTQTMEGTYSINDKHWKKISMQAKDLINLLLDGQPSTRLGLDEALNHSWFQKMSQNP